MALVLLAVIALLWLLIAAHRQKLGLAVLSVRGALVMAYVAFEVLVVLITESTSIGHHFTPATVKLVWAIVLLFLVGLAAPDLRRLARRHAGDHPGARRGLRLMSVADGLWLTVVLVVFGLLAVAGWLYPPSNGDSMTYHLVRVEHWIQDKSVAHFATHFLAQLESFPLAEFNLAHLHLLVGGDRLDGYVQLFAAVVCVIGASELARLLGASRRVQIMAAVLCVTIPSGILQATSTQNNYFAASIGLALLLLLFTASIGRGWLPRSVALGFAVGLAVLTKGTLPPLLAPAALLLVALVVRRDLRALGSAVARRRIPTILGIVAAAALTIAGPYLWRNVELFGGPTGPESSVTVSRQLTPRAAAANVIRSTTANFQIGNGKGGVETAVSKVALGAFGHLYSYLAVSQDDPRYLLGPNLGAFKQQDYSLRQRVEEYGANPWHVVLIVFAGLALATWVLRGARTLRTPLVLAVGLSLGYVLFTATVKWQPYGVRFALPLLVAWCPLIALALGRLHRLVGGVVLVGLVVACIPQLVNNAERPLVPSDYHFSSYLDRYFINLTGGYQTTNVLAYESVTGSIAESSCKQVGLANWVVVEYPLWAGLQHDHWRGTIQDVDVTNVSRRLEQADFRPCAWIRRVPPSYVAPDTGNVELQFGQRDPTGMNTALALSIDPHRAATVRTTISGFSSSAQDVRVLPGGGWAPGESGHGPALIGQGSLYLYSKNARRIRLELHEASPTTQPSLVVRGPRLQQIPAINANGTVVLDFQLQHGITRLQLSTAASPNTTSPRLDLTHLRVVDGIG